MYWWILALLVTNFLWAFYLWLTWKNMDRLADRLIYKEELIRKVFKALQQKVKDGDDSTQT